MGTKNSDESTAAIVVWVRMEETVNANLCFGHKGSQKGGLVQLEAVESGTAVVVIVVVVVVIVVITATARTEGRAKHCLGNGNNPIAGSSIEGSHSLSDDLCLRAMMKVDERGQCGEPE